MGLHALVRIAQPARKPQILFLIRPTQSFRMDVINFERPQHKPLRTAAVSTPIPSIAPDTTVYILGNTAHSGTVSIMA